MQALHILNMALLASILVLADEEARRSVYWTSGHEES